MITNDYVENHLLETNQTEVRKQVALDLRALQEQGAVTPAVLVKLTAGLTVHALCELVKTLKAANANAKSF